MKGRRGPTLHRSLTDVLSYAGTIHATSSEEGKPSAAEAVPGFGFQEPGTRERPRVRWADGMLWNSRFILECSGMRDWSGSWGNENW